MTNFQTKLRHADGNLPGLVVLRAVLIVALVALQSIQVSVSYGSVLATPLWILVIALPAALFFLAGFALATSAARVTPAIFLKRRTVELLPVAVVAILFAAFAVGLAATEAPKRAYLADADLWLFGARILVMAQARLPGLFEFNNEPWTVGANFWMITATAAGCILLAIASRPRWRLPALFAAFAILIVAAIGISVAGSDVLLGGSGAVLAGAALSAMTCFVIGAFAAYWPRHIPYGLFIALGAGGVLSGVAYVGNIRWQGNAFFDLLIAFPIAYLTLYTAIQRSTFTRLAKRAWPAMSGLPLYSFAVQQFWIAQGSSQQPAIANLALALPPTLLLSFLVHYLTRQGIVPKWFPALVRVPSEPVGPEFLPWDWKGELHRQLSPRALSQRFQLLVPRLFGAVLFLLVVLGLMALMMLAMQRDEAGI